MLSPFFSNHKSNTAPDSAVFSSPGLSSKASVAVTLLIKTATVIVGFLLEAALKELVDEFL